MPRDWCFSAYSAHWTAFFPWSRCGRFFQPGEIRLALLALLEQGPNHGYGLMKQLEARSGGLYRASAGAVYPTLQQLEDEGLLTSEQSDGKRIYRLTEAGRTELERQPDSVRRIWRRAETWGDWAPWLGPEAALIAAPAAALMKSALRAVTRGAGDPDRLWKVHDILDQARRQLEHLDNS
jgi:DNA-binding PadR family transcriptional regulator